MRMSENLQPKIYFACLVLWIPLLVFSGCNDTLSDAFDGLVSERSANRLAALATESPLLISLHGQGTLGSLPPLGQDGKKLGRFGSVVLVLVPRENAEDLTKVEALREMVLWGDASALEKLDPMLRNELLSGLALPNWQDSQYQVIGTFEGGDGKTRNKLEDSGVRLGSLKAGVATFSTDAETLFDILADPDLRQLKKPALQRWSQGH